MKDQDQQQETEVGSIVQTDAGNKDIRSFFVFTAIALSLIPLAVFLAMLNAFLSITVLLIVLLILMGLFFRGLEERDEFKKGRVDTSAYANASIILSVTWIISAALFTFAFFKIFSSMDLFSFSSDVKYHLSDYADDHEGNFPDANQWCDQLIESDDRVRWYSVSSDGVVKNMKYGFNKYAAPLGNEIPDDMVLLFEIEPSWNVTGGAELAKGQNNDVVEIVFGDQSHSRYRKKDVPYLRWRLEDDGVLPVRDKTVGFAILSGGVGVVLLAFAVKWCGAFRKYWWITVVLGSLSAGAGLGFCMMAEEMYRLNTNLNMSYIAGPVVGFGVGVIYVLMVGSFADRWRGQRNVMPFAVSGGAVVGVVCSCVVHGFLMIAYEETSLVNMAAGAIFGAYAGVILGWVTTGIMRKGTKAIRHKGTEARNRSANEAVL